jgi:hypothetical protein
MMRAVAAALRNEWMAPETWPAHLVALTGPGNRLPKSIRMRLVRHFVRNIGVSPDWADEVSSTALAQWAVELYAGAGNEAETAIEEEVADWVLSSGNGHSAPGDAGTTGGGQPSHASQPPVGWTDHRQASAGALTANGRRRYDAMVIGAPNGGVAHLAGLLRAPFLSQHFVIRFRYRGQADDVATYHAFGSKLATTILRNNPDLAVINHYDPLHDRFLIPYANYIRMKLLELPSAYVDFIRGHLRPGGTLLFSDCQYAWGQYRMGKRHSFQVGGLGGLADTEWIKDSPQVGQFLARQGRPTQKGWSLSYPWLSGPESEWGSLPPFRQAVEEFAAENGYRFRVLRGGHPEDFSRVAFYAGYQAALNADREPNGVLADCFTLVSPTAALRAGLLPLWLPFNCSDSLEFLRGMSPNFPRGKPVLLAPVPSYSPSWDVASAEQWQAACGAGADVSWIGVDPAAYPVDVAGLFRFVPDLQAWCAANQIRPRPPFSIADLETLIGNMAAQAAAEPQEA